MSKVALVIAHEGYQAIEYGTPRSILEQAGHTVITVSNKPGEATAHDNSTTPVETTIDKLSVDHFDGLFFIGGPGALDALDNTTSYELIRTARQAQKPVGAICIAVRILARAGILEFKKATGWDSDGKLDEVFQHNKITRIDKTIVSDDNILTAVGPEQAEAFGTSILSMLK